jgi:hypothetical protein
MHPSGEVGAFFQSTISRRGRVIALDGRKIFGFGDSPAGAVGVVESGKKGLG